MTKSFLVIAAIFVIVGGSIGGAFTGGVILGRNQAEGEAPVTAQFTQSGGQVGQTAAIQQFADQIPLDEDGNPDFAALRQRAQAQGGGLPTPPGRIPTASAAADSNAEATESAGFGRGLGLFGGGATFGTIDSIGDGVVIIDTPQGPVEASISSETVIQVFAAGELGDLIQGMSVTVMGQEDAESGRLEAVSIIASPEGAGAFPGFGGLPNRPQGGGRRP